MNMDEKKDPHIRSVYISIRLRSGGGGIYKDKLSIGLYHAKPKNT